MIMTTEPTTVADEPVFRGFSGWVRRITGFQAFQILVVLLGICLMFMILAPETFPVWTNIRQILQNMSILAVLGIGLTFVIMTAGIDMSVGSVLVFSGVVAAMLMRALGGQGWGVAILGAFAAIGSGMAWGLLNGLLIAKAKVPPFIVTLGTYGAALGLALVLAHGVDLAQTSVMLSEAIGYGNIPGTTIPILVLIALVLLVVGGTIFHKTRFGLYTAAVGSNEEAARRVGVNVSRQLIHIYLISGGLAGLAGILSLWRSTTPLPSTARRRRI